MQKNFSIVVVSGINSSWHYLVGACNRFWYAVLGTKWRILSWRIIMEGSAALIQEDVELYGYMGAVTLLAFFVSWSVDFCCSVKEGETSTATAGSSSRPG